MIDKKTREEIVKLLIKRKKRLGIKQFQIVCLHHDLNWIQDNLGNIMDDLESQKLIE